LVTFSQSTAFTLTLNHEKGKQENGERRIPILVACSGAQNCKLEKYNKGKKKEDMIAA
jgi:hypothetical protein